MSGSKKWLPLVVLSVALGIVTMDMTITNVSLSAIISSLHTDLRTFQWIVTIYSLILGALTITGGRLGDRFGRKKMFLLGAILFAVGSLVTAGAHQASQMLLGEGIINGIGAALMLPTSSALLLSMYREPKSRAIAFGFYTGMAGLTASIGPLLGGYLTTYHSWRWAYFINPFIIVFLLLLSGALKESRETVRKPRLDVPSVLLSIVGLALFMFGIIESSIYGWFKASQSFALFGHMLWFNTISIAFSSLIVGLVIIAAFVYYQKLLERRNRVPLVSTGLLTNKQFMSGSMTNYIITSAQFGTLFLLPIFWQIARGFNSFHAGLAVVALPIAILIAAPSAGILTSRLGIPPKRIIQTGIFLSMIGLIWLRFILSATISPWLVAPALALFGLGFGLTISPIANLTLSAVPVQAAGEASGVNSTFRQIGSSFGQALLGAIAIAGLIGSFTGSINAKLPAPQSVKTAVIESVQKDQEAALSSKRLSQLPQKDKAIVLSSIRQAAIDGDRRGLVVGTVLAGTALVVASTYLPLRMKHAGDLSAPGEPIV